jgi:serine/threonine protein kinase
MNDSPNGLYKNYRCRASDLWKLTMLGRGASGSVYKAVHKTTGELVALKEIDALDKVTSTSQSSALSV